MKRLIYAGYAAFIIVGATTLVATALAPHVLRITLIPDWFTAFVTVFVGGLIVGKSHGPVIRVVVLTTSVAAAWTIVLAVMPFRLVPSIGATLSEIRETHYAILLGALWGLILASLTEAIRFVAPRLQASAV